MQGVEVSVAPAAHGLLGNVDGQGHWRGRLAMAALGRPA